MAGRNAPKLAQGLCFAPGSVYLITSSKRPGEFKIGLAIDDDSRANDGKTWLGDVEVSFRFDYADRYHVEKLAHQEFSKLRRDGEWFIGDIEAAAAFLRRVKATQAPLEALLNANVRIAVELGIIKQELAAAPNTALEAILRWKLPHSKVSAGAAIEAALQGAGNTSASVRLLNANGLHVLAYDGVVLFELTESSPLVSYLDKAVGKGRWEHQLFDVAGIDKQARAVKMSEWLCATQADFSLKNWVQNDHSRRIGTSQRGPAGAVHAAHAAAVHAH